MKIQQTYSLIRMLWTDDMTVLDISAVFVLGIKTFFVTYLLCSNGCWMVPPLIAFPLSIIAYFCRERWNLNDKDWLVVIVCWTTAAITFPLLVIEGEKNYKKRIIEEIMES
jgi:ABC-type iron transport system FetAB permease component